MNNYSHLLVGVDLSPESAQIIERARQISRNHNARLTLVHVLEPLTFAYGGDIPMDLTEVQTQLQAQADEQLKQLAKRTQISEDDCQLLIGQPAAELHQLAAQQGCDLIVVGSHGRQGLALLLGSTANGVLHGANCDVLAVRVNEAD
ncbi:universal stress protein [Simiduia agarivorans]|uniref:Universal stress protein n=1 Tax=Simiduia agarivorans (strain DSM 21679 / JCM 13881 / BCRC 17597 / SA1) TaxID=1117647 RepID=K4KGW6_SIMAS|nr:universal stress protein [Simiduia agarivorans]AFU97455.1 universal stress protein A [Simiduia agarivorans SA1 = DSM 21679]